MTKNGGPSEIFSDGSGILVDPTSLQSIGDGLIDGLNRARYLSKAALERVETKYTWQQTATNYEAAIRDVLNTKQRELPIYPDIFNDNKYIADYLSSKS